ncbi:MAG: NDMA-dependent alcohol dehydrogenase [Ardenticatenaceae bacterium]
MAVKSRAALLYGFGEEFVIDEITVDDPKEGEIMVKLAATGLCHSDYHMVTGDFGPEFHWPTCGGHEGAGTVVQVGPGVKNFEVGDSVLLTFIPACGLCEWCAKGMSFLCDNGANIILGPQLDGTFRMHDSKGNDVGQFCMISTFSEYTTCPAMSAIKLDDTYDLTKICIAGCCVPTGFGSAVNTADVQPGESVVIFGIGGVGINAVQGAAIKGAAQVIAVDPIDFKLEVAEQLGATHTINPNNEDVLAKIQELTNGVGANKAIITIDNPDPDDIGLAFNCTGKGGRTVLTSVTHVKHQQVNISPFMLTLFKKELVGSLYGDSAVRADLPRYLREYRAGKLKIDELVTNTYTLDQINEGYADMLAGKNIRGVIVYD